MTEPLGLSVGTTNLVAARVGAAPVTRRSVLTLFNDRAPEVGRFPGPNQPGLVLAGFVERVGDPVPLVAADGSSHRGETVLVEALDAMAREVGRRRTRHDRRARALGPGSRRCPAQRAARPSRACRPAASPRR